MRAEARYRLGIPIEIDVDTSHQYFEVLGSIGYFAIFNSGTEKPFIFAPKPLESSILSEFHLPSVRSSVLVVRWLTTSSSSSFLRVSIEG